MDVWTWGAIALFLGPVLAGLAVPVLRWIFDDPRRLLLFALVFAGLAFYWKHSHPAQPEVTPTPHRAQR